MEELIDALRRVYAAEDVETGLRELGAIVHDDVELLSSGRFMDVSPKREVSGREEITGFFDEIAKAFGSVRYRILLLEVHGDVIVVKLLFHAEGHASGIAVEDLIWHVHRVRDGRIARIEVYTSLEQVEAAI